MALERLMENKHEAPMEVFNLGTGKGSTVLEVIESFQRATGAVLSYTMAPRRAGDVIAAYADTQRASAVLGWAAKKSLDESMRDAWAWQMALGSDSH
jgi:UDP-glucose 4-epimerase